MKYRAPKAIASHPAVQECASGEEGGSDYKHDVLLREGYEFRSGRMTGCRTGLFHTVQDFLDARPMRAAWLEQDGKFIRHDW
jgi:hypothetical protein